MNLSNAIDHQENNDPWSVRGYIYWSTILGLFSGAFIVHVPFAIGVFDALKIMNILLMVFVIDISRLARWILILVGYMAASGLVGIALGTDSVSQFAKAFLGITATIIYFYYFFKMVDWNYELVFDSYKNAAFWYAVIAIPMWTVVSIQLHDIERLHGLASESSAFCKMILPAYYWYAYAYFKHRKYGFRVLLFTFTVLVSGSSNSLLCVALGAMLLFAKGWKSWVLAPALSVSIFFGAYVFSSDFHLRVDDTWAAFVNRTVLGSNLSTFAFVTNVFVTQNVIAESPIIGNGLGSHLVSYDRFANDVPGIEAYANSDYWELCAQDASSLALRLLSELGIIGLGGGIFFLFKFYVPGHSRYGAISNALLICFVLKLIRDGTYFAPEHFYFLFTYYLNGQAARRSLA